MKIETSRFIMEKITAEDDVKCFAQISRRMTWKDTVELLLNEKKLEVYIRNIAKKDMELFLAKQEQIKANASGSQKIDTQLKDASQEQILEHFLEASKIRAQKYRQQIIQECKTKLGVDFENDKDALQKLKDIDLTQIQNENLKPPIPIDDWHYNIQFLKPDMSKIGQVPEEQLWFDPVQRYVQTGVSANEDEDSGTLYFKITDKETQQVVGISRISTKATEFVVDYDDKGQPITQVCVGDPGLFIDTSCQGKGRGSEIYAVTLSALYNFLLSEGDKGKHVVVKCNQLNEGSRKLQESIGANMTNESHTINGRYYFTVNEKDMLASHCVSKLEERGVDGYSVSLPDGTIHEVSLRGGILKTSKRKARAVKDHALLLISIQNMMKKVQDARGTSYTEPEKVQVALLEQNRLTMRGKSNSI